ncbi:SpoIIE family protein phosphatase [Streptomyces sp. NPDC060002]|uniref:SpoIIE family protein phosphatase n=1 Tax=Streptomyces sp. NPDC060002 TaxID=3347033 RepID=UPI00369A9BD3
MDVNDRRTDTTVLVVDRTAAGRFALGVVLRRAGHQVVAVGTGHEALVELDVRRRKGALPDVALVDVELPDMSGFELCRRLKARPHMAGLPVVHFSAGDVAPGDRGQGLDAGGEAHLAMPAEPEEIDAVVRAAVRAARLRAYCVDESDPAVLAERLDRMLQLYHPEVTATVCLVLIDPATGRTRIANAGHIPPLIVRDTQGADYAKAAGPLLGLGVPHPPPTELFLEPTDRLLMVTDGLIETRGIDLAVSMEHLRAAAIGAMPGLDALCDTLLTSFGHDREDDIAMLVLRLTA